MHVVQIACLTMVYRNYSIDRAFENIAKAGYKHVVIWNRHEDRDILADESNVSDILYSLKQYGLTPVLLFSHSQFGHNQPIEQAIMQIKIARLLGIQRINILSFWGYRQFPDQPITGEEYEALDRKSVEHLQAIAPYAEKEGVVITLKPHTANTATGAKIHDLISKIGSPLFKACYDPGNIRYYEGIDPGEDIQHILPEMADLIAKDHRGGRGNPDFPIPGEGDVDFADLFRQLRGAAFNGSVVIEKVENKDEHLTEKQISERILKARLNIKKLLEEAGFE